MSMPALDDPDICHDDPDYLAMRNRLVTVEAQLADATALMEAGIGTHHRCCFCGRFPPAHWEGCQYAAYLAKWTGLKPKTDVKNGRNHHE